MKFLGKQAIKRVLGELPLTAELYWQLRAPGKPLTRSFSLSRVEKSLPQWRAEAGAAREKALAQGMAGKRVLMFSTLRYWLEHSTLVGMALAGLGHDVTLAYLPYSSYHRSMNRFDLRRQDMYARHALRQAAPLLQPISWLDARANRATELPDDLRQVIQQLSVRDVQYTLQVEDFDLHDVHSQAGQLYRLRHRRNLQAAQAAWQWMRAHHPDVIMTPNGSILETGAVYQVARALNVPVVTYEFGEQRQRIWLVSNDEIMHQETGALWDARQDHPLTEAQWDQMRALYDSRQRGSLWENFSRRWQAQPGQGGEQTRKDQGLDGRPVILLAANVIGDSLTLARQVFSRTMTEWLERTVTYFARRPDVQLVVRIHPGERYTKGPSVADVVQRTLPQIPEHIHLVAADAPVNTYDLVDVADLGLVYTTTVGMEMAMTGMPVMVAGQTHYRQRGFTLDPATWEEYFSQLARMIEDRSFQRLTKEQVGRAWNYAYRFFFEYPCNFPWHLLYFWDELSEWSVARMLSAEGQAEYGDTFRYLVGQPRVWSMAADK